MSMTRVVKRPPKIVKPGDGLFRNDHCQIAYVTNDLARARAVFSERYGITDYLFSLPTRPPAAI